MLEHVFNNNLCTSHKVKVEFRFFAVVGVDGVAVLAILPDGDILSLYTRGGEGLPVVGVDEVRGGHTVVFLRGR